MDIRIKTEGALFDPALHQGIMTEELTAFLTRSSKALEERVAMDTPVNIGTAKGALFSKVRGVTVQRGTAIVSMPVNYAEPLDEGGKPHWPPRAPIELWVRQRWRDKMGSMRASVKTLHRRGSGKPGIERGIRNLAFLVARKIARDGTKAVRMFTHAQKDLERDITLTWWEQTLSRIAKRLESTTGR